MQSTREREQELATTLQVEKAKLLSLLLQEEQTTTRRNGSTYPDTFEDKAARIAQDPNDPRAEALGQRVAAFRAAVNNLWTYAQATGISDAIAAEWRKTHKGYGWIDRDSVEAEALMSIRRMIVRFHAGNGRLFTFALRGVMQDLTEWAAQQGPVQLPRAVARGFHPDAIPFDEEVHAEAVDLEAVVNEAIDHEQKENNE